MLTLSLLLRVWGSSGRVRKRLLLLAVSATAGGVYRAATTALWAQPAQGLDSRGLAGLTVVTGVTIAVGLGMAGLVVAADAGTGRHAWLRRVLDGAVTAGTVFMAGWVLLGRAGDGWRPETGMFGLLWASEVVSLGFLLVLRRLVRGDQQGTVWAAIVGLFLMLIGDTLRLRIIGGPHGPEAMSFQLGDVCVTAGLLVIAVGPWVPGGGSVLVAGRPALRSGSAFIVLTVCTVTALGYALAPLAYDPVSLLVGGTVMLGLWARRILLPGENVDKEDD
ncbi:hypothetical protein ACGFNV_28745 [Streptomyces sp. NPDC048751]|uniref:hypothetical protein n=1 Tax=Streptomyces sp. NPDC048751 TaxID=3365591 RepID=UPI00371B6366